jgi:hypothetical protein
MTQPTFNKPLRVIAQSIRGGEFLTWDLPLSNIEITYTLSGPQLIQGVFENEVSELQDLGLTPWGTWIHVEDQGLIRASGILQPFSQTTFDQSLTINALGVSSYPIGLPFLGDLTASNADPVDIIEDIWEHIQEREDGNLGVVVRGSSASQILTYKLSWTEAPDCGDEISKIVKENGFDFIEVQEWNADKTDVLHYIDHADRVGSRRFDLQFIEGENLMVGVGVEEASDAYASEVWVYGAGEGTAVVRGYYGAPNQQRRIRRALIVQDSSVSTIARANELARFEYLRRQSFNEIGEIEVNGRHVNAPFGSFGPGDDLMLHANVPWIGKIRQWYRVLSLRLVESDDTLILSVRRSDTFKN